MSELAGQSYGGIGARSTLSGRSYLSCSPEILGQTQIPLLLGLDPTLRGAVVLEYVMQPLSFLAVGKFTAAQVREITEASAAAAREVEFLDPLQGIAAWQGSRPVAGVLVGGSSPSSSRVVLECRSDSDYASLPIIVLADRVTDLAFGETFNHGADDIADLHVSQALTRRLRVLPAEPTALPPPTRGCAVVAVADQTRRVVVGRVLRNAGYDVTFALAAQDAIHYAAERSAVLVLLDSTMVEDPRAVVLVARDASSSTLWIVSTIPKNLAALRLSLAGVQNAATVDGYSTPENVLFTYNEYKNGGRVGQRSSTRLLYGTTVAMRPEGYEADDYGFTYNVSANGLYIRTLAVPEQNTIWLELLPPRTERRVRLVGEVAWRRQFEPSVQATVPPGFGVRIVDGSRRDLEAWSQGCASFERAFA